MSQERGWNLESIRKTQHEIGNELLPLVQNEKYVEGIELCLKNILPIEANTNSDLVTICYIISALNLISFSREANTEYRVLVLKLEKIAKSLLDKNNIKAGKSKLSFLHGQLKQGLAAILKNDGDTWGALWEASLGLYLSRGSANPVLPFQHLHLAIQTIDRGFPLRVSSILDDMEQSLTSPQDRHFLDLVRIKTLRLSGQHDKGMAIINRLIKDNGESDRLLWEKAYTNAIVNDETKELHRLLFGRNRKKLDYSEAYLKYCFWMRAQPKREFNKLCPKVSKLKRLLKGYTSSTKFKKLFKVLTAIEECYDIHIPMISRVKKIGKIMPVIESLEAEYRILALAGIVRWMGQRQKQMAAIFHGEYQSLSLKMSEGTNIDIFKLFESNLNELEMIRPFYDTLHTSPVQEEDDGLNTIDKALFRSLWLNGDSNQSDGDATQAVF
ncbi:hypothetical protein [Pseudobacteriovorax antillogorgiicola]|uniref:Uncharacterized protein n=1 Tax=Pseudobacteriovorax antillogorgiicola TaxID=1513793 RepID=A0A1Y6BL72_9BACT|nr:hypothetical protein [Pseudobacteriovorax antillogorgiicola]TCS54622.1 hypothetical protein EDD56_106135 [Pseudobacteriovorax antillogorgiicola]SMF17355.1 hypothetical protein SAMN06296036_106108 [Pseudobacteriovorax antillogorgiicola]